MAGLRVEPRLDSFNMDSIFGDTLPTLPYNSFTGTHNVFFHEGLQAVAPVESTSLEDSGSMEHSSGSPTTVMAADLEEEKTAPAAKGSRGGRKSSSKVKDQEQLERIRAKNRRAQSRYRAKLKALQQTTIQSHDQVAEELARLRVENAALARSNDLMDRVLTVREDYMASLKTGAALMDADTLAMGSVTDARRPNGAMLALPESAASVLANAGADGNSTTCPLTGLNRTEVAKIKCSDAKAVVAAWQTLVPRLEDALTQLKTARDDRSRAEADEAMHEALHEARMYCFEHAVYKPHNIQQLLAANLGVGKDGIADVDHWSFVMSELELTDEQRHSLAPLRELFLRRIARVMAERRAILGALASASPHDSLQALQESTVNWLSVNRATGELSANLQQEHLVCMEFVSRAFGGVLSPLQKAVAIVRSYPYFPDIYSISTAAIGVDQHQPASLIAPVNGSANNNSSTTASDTGSVAVSGQTDDASHGSCP